MAKTWILDTETKGTGAHIAPLPRPNAVPPRERALDTVTLRRPERRAVRSEPARSPMFKVVDVMSAKVITEGVDARAAVEALGPMRSVHDARVYVWVASSRRWRLLTFAEQRSLWRMRACVGAEAPAHDGA